MGETPFQPFLRGALKIAKRVVDAARVQMRMGAGDGVRALPELLVLREPASLLVRELGWECRSRHARNMTTWRAPAGQVDAS
jgi:hypothetical protein